MANARERLYAAEEKFAELTDGGRELITAASEPQFVFCDGESVKGWTAAADAADRKVSALEEQIRRNNER